MSDLPSSGPAAPPVPRISVLVPTHNYARFLPETIESILAQDADDFELLVSDDASTDDSAAVIRDYVRRDRRVRFVRHPVNLGMVANWNWCLQQARGRYVKYVFGDDVLAAPDALRHLADALDRHPRARLATSSRIVLDAGSHATGLWDDLPAGWHDGAELIASCFRRRRNLVGEPSAVMFRRDAALRGFDPAFRQIVDLELWMHLLLEGGLVCAARPLCGFRRHEAQQTAVNHRLRAADLEFIALLDRYLGVPSVQPHLRRGSWAHRRVIFREMYYACKAGDGHPAAVAAGQHLAARLSPGAKIGCWLWHRLARPVENFAHKIQRWRRWHGAPRDLAWTPFLASLPARTGRRREVVPAAISAARANAPLFQSLALALRSPAGRGVSIALLLLGIASGVLLFSEEASENTIAARPRPAFTAWAPRPSPPWNARRPPPFPPSPSFRPGEPPPDDELDEPPGP